MNTGTRPAGNPIDKSPTWLALRKHRDAIKRSSLEQLFHSQPERGTNFSASGGPVYLNYSKNLVSEETLQLLVELADSAELTRAIEDLFNGQPVNNTERRAALHTALRGSATRDESIGRFVSQTLERMAAFSRGLRDGSITGSTGKAFKTLVNIGIGGSDLGPRLAINAFPDLDKEGLTIHFAANIDSGDLQQTLQSCTPETTLFMVSSKSFSTLETLHNAQAARRWLSDAGVAQACQHHHFAIATANPEAAQKWGASADRIFPLGEWVGGRYSLWSAIGLPVMAGLGETAFTALLNGAREMDNHFREAPFASNLPVIHGLLAIWQRNFLGYHSQAVLPYIHGLALLPCYLQQLVMESLGKSVRRDGTALDIDTGAVVWGEEGTNGQHSFHQLLLQGTETVPVDFIITQSPHCEIDAHRHLVANCLAQSRALMQGRSRDQAFRELLDKGFSQAVAKELALHQVVTGNRPSNTLILDDLSPRSLGALLAFYEHSVYVQSTIWDINPFDQWGVELGKNLSREIYDALNATGKNQATAMIGDKATDALLERLLPSHPKKN